MKKFNVITLNRKQTGLIILSVLLIIAGMILNQGNSWLLLWTNFVALNWYFLLLGISALLLFSMQSIVPNTWFQALRYQSLQTSTIIKYLLFSFLLIFATSHFFFSRNNESVFQEIWFYPLFLLLRAMLILLSWYLYANKFLQQATSWTEKTRKRKSIEFLLLFLFTFSLFSWDWLMSIQANYHSALFSFYMLLSGLLLVCGFLLLKNHRNKQIHTFSNDLGRLTLAFSLLWVYLFFSQFLIAWYTAIPVEIEFYHLIFQAEFPALLIISVTGNFVLPFLMLLSNKNRHAAVKLVWVGISILIAKWFELYLLIAVFSSRSISIFPLTEIGFIILATLGVLYLLDKKKSK